MKRIIINLLIICMLSACSSISGYEEEEELVFEQPKRIEAYACSAKTKRDTTFNIFINYNQQTKEVLSIDIWQTVKVAPKLIDNVIGVFSKEVGKIAEIPGAKTFITQNEDQNTIIIKYSFIKDELDYELLAKSDYYIAALVISVQDYDVSAMLRYLENTAYDCQVSQAGHLIRMVGDLE